MCFAISPNAVIPLPENCLVGRFVRRVKRFSMELEVSGQSIWAHCNNSGAMLGLVRQNAPVLVSKATNPSRKLPYTVERVWQGGKDGFWTGVNTSMPNRLLEAAFQARVLPFVAGYTIFKREKKTGQSRLDACLASPGLPMLWVECKNVTMVEDDCAAFPDAPSVRARKHLREMMTLVANGDRAAMFFLVQRPDGHCFAPADFIDPEYAELFYRALDAGVEAYAYRGIMQPTGTEFGELVKLRGI